MARAGRDYILRHGETVFNAARRFQGEHVHTPLTLAGVAQADAAARTLRDPLGPRPALTLWASPTGRALQTLATIAERLDLDWHAARTDGRLCELDTGAWGGMTYAEVAERDGPPAWPGTGLLRPAPGGESYADLAARLGGWLADTHDDPGDRLVVTHGIAGRVLRGLMTGLPPLLPPGVPAAAGLPQGSVVLGTGHAPA